MVAGRARKHAHHTVKLDKPRDTRILKSGVIYGANAAGKSNLVKAIDYARWMVIRGNRPKESIPVYPYRFSPECRSKPSTFSFEFSTGDSSYIYGFSLDSQQIHEEWLYEIRATTEQMLFERETSEDGETTVEFNLSLNAEDTQFVEFTARGTRANQLFLTETIERNITYFEHIDNWFRHALVIVHPDSKRRSFLIQFMMESDFQSRFKKLLKQFDTGISDLRLEKIDFNNLPVPDEIASEIRNDMLNEGESDDSALSTLEGDGLRYLLSLDGNKIIAQKIMTGHGIQTEEGNEDTVYLEVFEESDGTQRLFDILPGLMDLLDGEKVFIIDELDRSLHPHLTRNILALFLAATDNKSQLIVTTHDATLLDLDLLRRDEIWFVEKKGSGASDIYSLEEYAPRHDTDIRKGYLLGRYGAIPFINTHRLLNDDTGDEYAEEENV
jgi:hypothetical protein